QFMNESKPASSGGGSHREVIVSDFKQHSKGTLQGFFTATLPSGMVVHGLMLHKRDGQRWVGLPGREYTDKNGQRQFNRIIEFASRTTSDRFQAEILAAVDRHLQGVNR